MSNNLSVFHNHLSSKVLVSLETVPGVGDTRQDRYITCSTRVYNSICLECTSVMIFIRLEECSFAEKREDKAGKQNKL